MGAENFVESGCRKEVPMFKNNETASEAWKSTVKREC